jgi:hypothetical protein
MFLKFLHDIFPAVSFRKLFKKMVVSFQITVQQLSPQKPIKISNIKFVMWISPDPCFTSNLKYLEFMHKIAFLILENFEKL